MSGSVIETVAQMGTGTLTFFSEGDLQIFQILPNIFIFLEL